MQKGILDPYRGLIQRMVVEQIMAALSSAAPWVNLPVIRQTITGVIGLVVKLVLAETILGLNIAYVVTETSIDLLQFKKALKKYKEMKDGGADDILLERKENEIVEIGFDLIDFNHRRL